MDAAFADTRTENVQRLSKSGIFRGTKLRFVYKKSFKIGVPAFIAGFLTCAWLNIVNRPPPVVVKKVVRKKKPKLTIEEIPDDEGPGPGVDGAEARPGEEMKMVLVVNDSLGMSAGEALGLSSVILLVVPVATEKAERARGSPT